MSLLELYPKKGLNEFFLQYDSFLKLNILLILMSSILNGFFHKNGTF